MKRFDHDADSIDEAFRYLHNRGIQLLKDGFRLVNLRKEFAYRSGVPKVPATCGSFVGPNGRIYHSYYVLKSARGKGVYMDCVNHRDFAPIITVPDCDIEAFLKAKLIPHVVAGDFHNNITYKLISRVYGNVRAKRSGHFYMDHIDEGLAILRDINASLDAWEGFCLHPIFQMDHHYKLYGDCMEALDIPAQSAVLATEYRHVANAYLSPMGRRKAKDIQLSPLKDVNDMLIADKVQNRKAFEAHRNKYPNAADLDYYFKAWLERLGISEQEYQRLAKLITL